MSSHFREFGVRLKRRGPNEPDPTRPVLAVHLVDGARQTVRYGVVSPVEPARLDPLALLQTAEKNTRLLVAVLRSVDTLRLIAFVIEGTFT